MANPMTESSEQKQLEEENLKDIDTLFPNAEDKISDKVNLFLNKSENQPYAHINEGYVVIVKMTGAVEATDAISDYLRKKTELIY